MKTHPDMLAFGDPAPDFQLPGVSGETYQLSDFQKPIFVYVQGCNHCPYVLAYLKRLKQIARDYAEHVDLVMVNSNDAEQYPSDDFDAMQTFAKTHALPFAYLFDADQSVARAYRAFRTPELMVFGRDRRLAYRGRIDDSVKEPEKATTRELRDALEALIAGEPVLEPETYAIGCTVKWKPGNEPVLAE